MPALPAPACDPQLVRVDLSSAASGVSFHRSQVDGMARGKQGRRASSGGAASGAGEPSTAAAHGAEQSAPACEAGLPLHRVVDRRRGSQAAAGPSSGNYTAATAALRSPGARAAARTGVRTERSLASKLRAGCSLRALGVGAMQRRHGWLGGGPARRGKRPRDGAAAQGAGAEPWSRCSAVHVSRAVLAQMKAAPGHESDSESEPGSEPDTRAAHGATSAVGSLSELRVQLRSQRGRGRAR